MKSTFFVFWVIITTILLNVNYANNIPKDNDYIFNNSNDVADELKNKNEENASDNIEKHQNKGSISDSNTNDKNNGIDLEGRIINKSEITEKDFKLGDIKLYMEISEVEAIMKSQLVEAIDISDILGKSTTLKYKDGTVINLLDDQVYSIFVVSPNYSTSRGLVVGDSKERVIELYGNPLEQESKVWHYEGFGEYDLFHVHLEEDKVIAIEVKLVM